MNASFAALAYLVSGVLFILSLRGLSSPETSRQGNTFGMIGMALAVGVTLATLWTTGTLDTLTLGLIAGGVIVGQIHAKDNPYPFLKLSYRLVQGVGYLDVTLRRKPTDTASPVVLTYKSMPLNTAFDYSFKVSPSGRLDVNVAGMQYSTTVNTAWAKKAFYFGRHPVIT